MHHCRARLTQHADHRASAFEGQYFGLPERRAFRGPAPHAVALFKAALLLRGLAPFAQGDQVRAEDQSGLAVIDDGELAAVDPAPHRAFSDTQDAGGFIDGIVPVFADCPPVGSMRHLCPRRLPLSRAPHGS